jgi:hypothetical protein
MNVRLFLPLVFVALLSAQPENTSWRSRICSHRGFVRPYSEGPMGPDPKVIGRVQYDGWKAEARSHPALVRGARRALIFG